MITMPAASFCYISKKLVMVSIRKFRIITIPIKISNTRAAPVITCSLKTTISSLPLSCLRYFWFFSSMPDTLSLRLFVSTSFSIFWTNVTMSRAVLGCQHTTSQRHQQIQAKSSCGNGDGTFDRTLRINHTTSAVTILIWSYGKRLISIDYAENISISTRTSELKLRACRWTTRKPSWSKGDARQQCTYKDPWQILIDAPVDFLLMVNSIRGRILLIVCDILLCKEAENRHFGKYSDAIMAVYSFKVIQVYWFWYQLKAHVHIPISHQ